jgi:uncharacterized protein YbjT (DUF2867 family)
MRVFVTGGTGFVGPAIVRELLGRGHQVTLLVHRSLGPFRGDEAGLNVVHGNVTRPGTFGDAVRGHDAVIHLVALRRGTAAEYEEMHTEATRSVVNAAQAAGAKRFIYMSAEGVTRQRTPYEKTKVKAEDIVRGSGLGWTIFRPNFMTGPAEDDAGGFDHEFAAMVQGLPLLPSFDGGQFKMQPIAKGDVARAVAVALEWPAVANGKVYPVGGPETITWNAYLRAVGEAMGRSVWLVPIPTWLAKPAATLLGGFDWFPASREELDMLVGDHVEDNAAVQRELGITLTPWKPALRESLAHPPRAPSRRRAWGGRPRHA